MLDPLDITLRDGRRGIIRPIAYSDAPRTLALDRRLAEDGRGMVLSPAQIRGPEEERRRIEALHHQLASGDATLCLVADVQGVDAMAGTAQLNQLGPSRCRHVGVLSLGVHPEVQRQGIGRALMNALIAHAEASGLTRLELYVRADNERAHALYRGLGFVEEARRARFVRLEDGRYVDDLIMTRFLARPSAPPPPA